MCVFCCNFDKICASLGYNSRNGIVLDDQIFICQKTYFILLIPAISVYSNIVSISELSFGQGYLYVWPVVDEGHILETCLKPVIINFSGAEATHFTC